MSKISRELRADIQNYIEERWGILEKQVETQPTDELLAELANVKRILEEL